MRDSAGAAQCGSGGDLLADALQPGLPPALHGIAARRFQVCASKQRNRRPQSVMKGVPVSAHGLTVSGKTKCQVLPNGLSRYLSLGSKPVSIYFQNNHSIESDTV